MAFCATHFEEFQESSIDYGLVISNFQNNLQVERVFLNKKLKKKARAIFDELLDSLNKSIPSITKDRNKCCICSWQKYCDEEAKSKGLLTDIDGVGFKTEEDLQKAGINNVSELALSDKDDLSRKLSIYKETSPEKTNKLITQSKAYISGIPSKIIPDNTYLLNLHEKIKSGFFVFDIESNPDENHDFLYGFLSIKNINEPLGANSYEPILDLDPKNNKRILVKLLKKINSHKDWPIFHYGETEKISIIKMAREMNLNSLELEKIKSRFIDLHLLIRFSWILPLKNYS